MSCWTASRPTCSLRCLAYRAACTACTTSSCTTRHATCSEPVPPFWHLLLRSSTRCAKLVCWAPQEDNHAPDDLSSTERYRRDSPLHFLLCALTICHHHLNMFSTRHCSLCLQMLPSVPPARSVRFGYLNTGGNTGALQVLKHRNRCFSTPVPRALPEHMAAMASAQVLAAAHGGRPAGGAALCTAQAPVGPGSAVRGFRVCVPGDHACALARAPHGHAVGAPGALHSYVAGAHVWQLVRLCMLGT